VLIGVTLTFVYFVLFSTAPFVNRSARSFGERVKAVLNEKKTPSVVVAAPVVPSNHEVSRRYSSYDGFKSFAQGGALSIEDLVKGLSRAPATHEVHVTAAAESIVQNVEPIYDYVEPIVEEQIEPVKVAINEHHFASAIVSGDRVAVFASLREHVQSGGAPEHLLSKAACHLDDVYRSRVEGTECDADLARLTARLDTSTLEKLVASLVTAIDSSYSTGVTGAKLALARALAILGA
jgi:hypothetical protein